MQSISISTFMFAATTSLVLLCAVYAIGSSDVSDARTPLYQNNGHYLNNRETRSERSRRGWDGLYFRKRLSSLSDSNPESSDPLSHSLSKRGWEGIDVCGCCHSQRLPTCCYHCMRIPAQRHPVQQPDSGTQWLKMTLCLCCERAQVETCCQLCSQF